MSRKTKGIILCLKGLVAMWALERSWVDYFYSRALHGNHPQVWGFWYFKNPLSAGISQPVGGSLGGVLAPSLLPGTLEGAEILGSQIKAKGSIWIGRKEKAVFCTVAGKLSSESLVAVPLVPRAWISLQESRWGWQYWCYRLARQGFLHRTSNRRQSWAQQGRFQGHASEALRPDLDHEPRRNSILHFKTAWFIWMTKRSALCSVKPIQNHSGTFAGKASLPTSCCLHRTCGCLFLRQEKEEA